MGYTSSHQQVFSGTLAAAGAFTTGSTIRTEGFDYLNLHLLYLSGAAGGAPKVYVQVTNDGGSNWFDKTVTNYSGTVAGVTRSDTATDVRFISSGSSNRELIIPVHGNRHMRLQVAEYGNTGTPGVLIVSASLVK
jgi:hypothetical protein